MVIDFQDYKIPKNAAVGLLNSIFCFKLTNQCDRGETLLKPLNPETVITDLLLPLIISSFSAGFIGNKILSAVQILLLY